MKRWKVEASFGVDVGDTNGFAASNPESAIQFVNNIYVETTNKDWVERDSSRP